MSSSEGSGNPPPIDLARVQQQRARQQRAPPPKPAEAAVPRLRYASGDVIEEHHEGGTKTGRQVVRYIASGTFGDVYEVVCRETQQREAMKMITLTDVRTGEALSDKERVRRLRPHVLEAHAMLEIGAHPNLVGLRAAYQIGTDFYFFEDLVPGGRSLKGLMRSVSALPTERAAFVALEMARGLAHVHARGFVHWDVKPDNTLVEDRGAFSSRGVGAVKVTDFGLATRRAPLKDDADGRERSRPDDAASASTCSSSSDSCSPAAAPRGPWFLGCTDAYASPETRAVARSRVCSSGGAKTAADARVRRVAVAARGQDQWSLGVVLVEMLTGARPRRAADCGGGDQGKRHIDSSTQKQRIACLDAARRCLDADPLARPSMPDAVAALASVVGGGGAAHNEEPNLTKEPQNPKEEEEEEDGFLSCAPEGDDSDALAKLHQNLGTAFYKLLASSPDDFEKGRRHLEACARVETARHGEASAERAAAVNALGEFLLHKGAFDAAAPLLTLALHVREKVSLRTDADADEAVAESLNNVALVKQTRGEHEAARALLERAVCILETRKGAEHPDVAPALNNLAGCLSKLSSYDEAKELYERALTIRLRALGDDHVLVAGSLNNLAECWRARGRYDEARVLFAKALNIVIKALGEKHPNVATALNNLGECHRARGEYDEAEHRLERALDVYERALGPDHHRVATTLDNLARLLEARAAATRRVSHATTTKDDDDRDGTRRDGQLERAEALARRGLDVRRAALGDDHARTALSRSTLGWIRSARGDRDDASEWHRAALETCARLDETSPVKQIVRVGCLVDEARGLRADGDPRFQDVAARALALAESAHRPVREIQAARDLALGTDAVARSRRSANDAAMIHVVG